MYKEKICGIYCIENKVLHKKYIGQSRNIKARWLHHKNELQRGEHCNDFLQEDLNKYGEESFEYYILKECSVDELDNLEKYYISLLDTTNSFYGYNLTEGGQDNHTVSKEVCKKMSIAIKNSYDDALKEQRRQDALKQLSNPEIKAKIMGKNNGMYGKSHSEYARKRISETHRNPTPVYCVELDRVFDNAITAGQELGFRGTCILNVCRGIHKTTHGYHWQFVSNKEE